MSSSQRPVAWLIAPKPAGMGCSFFSGAKITRTSQSTDSTGAEEKWIFIEKRLLSLAPANRGAGLGLGFALALGLPLVVDFLAFTDGQLAFHKPILEIDLCRDDGEPFLV